MRGPGFVLHLNTENRTLKTLNHNPLTLALSPAGERGQLQESRNKAASLNITDDPPPFSPSGEKVAGGRMRGPGFVLHLNTENRTLKTLNHNPLTLALSPAGERGQLQESRNKAASLNITDDPPPFSPSGEKVAGGRMRGPGFVLHLKTEH